MAYEYIFGGLVIAYLVGLAFLFVNFGKKPSKEINGKNTNGFSKVPSNGPVPEPEMSVDTDVVIVGAGVAGAALAYTLGKVIIYNHQP